MPIFESRLADWLSLPEAQARILEGCAPLPPRDVPLVEAAGMALARPLYSPATLPPGPTSHMDGYALAAASMSGPGASLPVVGTSLPGSPYPRRLPPGTALRIMTGGLLPEGADTVVPVEETDRERIEGTVVLFPSHPLPAPFLGRHVRAAGEEMRAGEQLAEAGDTIEPGLLALLAATGWGELPVFPSPRVALLTTGSELVSPGDLVGTQGGIRRVDLLSPTLPLLIQRGGGTPLPPRRVPDDADQLRAAITDLASEADLLLTTGGASMGEADLVKEVLESLGLELDFWRIRMRPGSPVSFGRLPRPHGGAPPLPVLGLPGNPVSAFATFLVLALPAIRALGGHRRHALPPARGRLLEPLPGPEHLTRLFRVTLSRSAGGEWEVRPSGAQGSGVLRSLALADALALIPEGAAAPKVGEEVELLLLRGGGW